MHSKPIQLIARYEYINYDSLTKERSIEGKLINL